MATAKKHGETDHGPNANPTRQDGETAEQFGTRQGAAPDAKPGAPAVKPTTKPAAK